MTDQVTTPEQKKLLNAAKHIELPKAFTTKFPDLKPDKAQKLFRRYIDTVASALLPKLPFLGEDNMTYISTDKLIDGCGEFRYKTKRYYVWNEFKTIYPFFEVRDPGSNLKKAANPFEKNSKIQVYERMTKMMLNERSPATVFDELYQGVDFGRDDIASIEIDMDNLQRFIDCTELELTKENLAPAHRAKLQRSIYQAELAYKVGLHTEEYAGAAVLPLIPSPSPFGRIYYKGLNIQNVTKQVRSAILGHHFQYDMNAAVYGVKLALFNMIRGGENALVNTRNGTYTREYLTDKHAIRKRLATKCFEGFNFSLDYKIGAIKQALTAIGFGAKTSSGFWMDENDSKGPALTEILKSPVVRECFLEDDWVRKFLAEQNVIEDEIVANFKEQPGYQEISEVIRERNGTNGRVRKPLLLAYIYQHWEKTLMNDAEAILNKYGITVLAMIHDAFIVRDKIPQKVMDEIYVAWGKYSSHIKLDVEEVHEWQEAAAKRALQAADEEYELHKLRMKNEEFKAQDRWEMRTARKRLAELKAAGGAV